MSEKERCEGSPYEDMLEMPHVVSRVHPQMSLRDRAAQFAPFAALVGFGAQIEEEGRVTQARRELDEQARAELDVRVGYLLERVSEHPEVTVEFFEPDALKAGGAYVKRMGVVKRVRMDVRRLEFEDGTAVALDDVVAVEGAVFARIEDGE